jgi:hypothetical protein
MIVVVNHTVMSGQVARFYATENAARNGVEKVSASRDGVLGGAGYITPEAFEAAWAAHLRLARREDVRDIATHTERLGEYLAVAEPNVVRPDGSE